MVTLPGEDSAGPLPDRLPRRSGVGGWQPDVISRDTSQFGQGFERLGQDIGIYDASQARQQDALTQARGDSLLNVANIQTGEKLKNATDPTQIAPIKDEYNSNLSNAAQVFPEGPQRDNFMMRHAPTIAQGLANADGRAKELSGQSAVAQLYSDRDNTIRAAAGIDNDAASAAAVTGLGPQIQALQAKGYITAETAQRLSAETAQQYVLARKNYLVDDARRRGDTSRLERFRSTIEMPGAQGPVNMNIPPEGRALLATIYGPESGGDYNRRFAPQGNATFQGYGDHPRITEKIDPNQPDSPTNRSDAAGAPQFLSRTWDIEAKKLGLKDFSPANQDAAAWDLAQTAYKQQTRGGDLLTALKSSDPRVIAGVADALKGQWPSLPGGVQPGTTTSKFVSQFQSNLATAASQPGGAKNAGPFVGLPAAAGQVAGPGATTQHDPNSATVGPAGTDQAPNGAALPPQGVSATAVGPIQTDAQGRAIQANGQPNLQLVPDRSKWPEGTDHVQPNADGSLSYVTKDGVASPVPGSKATGSPGLPLPTRPSGSLLDFLHPVEHAQVGLEIDNAIDLINRQKAQAIAFGSKQAAENMKGASAALTSGQGGLGPVIEQFRQAYAAHPDPAVREQFAALDAVNNQIQTYRGETPTQIAAQIDNIQRDYTKTLAANPDDPHLNLKASVLQASKDYLKNYQTDLAKDPLGRAAKEGVLPNDVTPINPSSPTIVDDLRQRAAQAQHVAEFYGQAPQYLLPPERVALKQISQTGGQPMVDLAGHVVAGMGDNAGRFFKEIGGDAPAFSSVGALKVVGGDPQVIDDIAKYTAAMHDKNAKGDLPRFNEELMRKRGLLDPLADAYSAFGADQTARMRATANIIMGARASREGTDPKIDPTQFTQTFFDKAYNQAIGATYDADGNQYGGIAKHGGGWTGNASSETTLAPYNMKASEFTHAIDSLTDNDIRSLPTQPFLVGGHPLTAQDIKTAHLTAMPDKADGLFHGRYTAIMGDPNSADAKPVVGQDGKPWTLDLDRLEPNIRSRLPGIYLGKSPTPAGSPYRGTPGMIPTGTAEDPDGTGVGDQSRLETGQKVAMNTDVGSEPSDGFIEQQHREINQLLDEVTSYGNSLKRDHSAPVPSRNEQAPDVKHGVRFM